MLPKYTYFKLHDPAVHKYNSTLEYRCDLVKRQITLCKNNIDTLNLDGNMKGSKKKICRQKMSIMFYEICINEEMLPKYTYIYINIYINSELVNEQPIGAIAKAFNIVRVLQTLLDKYILLFDLVCWF